MLKYYWISCVRWSKNALDFAFVFAFWTRASILPNKKRRNLKLTSCQTGERRKTNEIRHSCDGNNFSRQKRMKLSLVSTMTTFILSFFLVSKMKERRMCVCVQLNDSSLNWMNFIFDKSRDNRFVSPEKFVCARKGEKNSNKLKMKLSRSRG